jgi:hypothetical protein
LMIPTPENIIYYVNRFIVAPTALQERPFENVSGNPPSFIGA